MIKFLFFIFSILSAFSLSTAFGQQVQSHSLGTCFLQDSNINVEPYLLYDNKNSVAELHIDDDTGTIASGFTVVPADMHEYSYDEIDSNAVISYLIATYPMDRNQIDNVIFIGNDLEKGFATGLLAFFNGANELVYGFYVVDGDRGAYCMPPADDSHLN